MPPSGSGIRIVDDQAVAVEVVGAIFLTQAVEVTIKGVGIGPRTRRPACTIHRQSLSWVPEHAVVGIRVEHRSHIEGVIEQELVFRLSQKGLNEMKRCLGAGVVVPGHVGADKHRRSPVRVHTPSRRSDSGHQDRQTGRRSADGLGFEGFRVGAGPGLELLLNSGEGVIIDRCVLRDNRRAQTEGRDTGQQ